MAGMLSEMHFRIPQYPQLGRSARTPTSVFAADIRMLVLEGRTLARCLANRTVVPVRRRVEPFVH
jgi:hypothetical protein